MNLPSELREALSGETTPKFLGTVDLRGQPNCVPVTTITPYDEETLVFGEFMLNKTRRNLMECANVGIATMTETFETWALTGTFLGFETQGKHVDFINGSRLFRYNAYTSIRAAGIIRVDEVSPKRALDKRRLLCGFARVGVGRLFMRTAAGTAAVMPGRVMEKFSRLSAVRALTYLDGPGRPKTFAMMVCVPAGPGRLLLCDSLFKAREPSIPNGGAVAVCVITRDPIAYQVKGRYLGRRGGIGVVDVTECYSASPPLVGERLDAGHRAAAGRWTGWV
jgi:hypothetical protein